MNPHIPKLSPHWPRAVLLPSLLLLMTATPGCRKNSPESSPVSSVLRVTATIQYPDMRRPWLKKPPFTRCGLGTVIEGGRILVTAEMVAHAKDISLEKPEDGPKSGGTVEAIDEECDLAVIRPSDPAILKETRPLALAGNPHPGETLRILQLEANGSAALSPATVTTVALLPYPAEGGSYLTCRVAATIPQRDGSFVIPALSGNRLAGLVMRYDPRTQSADILPAPVIARFLSVCFQPGFRGLGRAGLSWETARGSTLKKWLGVPRDKTGVFITSVEPQGPAAKAGLRPGDLLTDVDGMPIDGEGNYADPSLGKISFSHVAGVLHSPGDPLILGYFRSIGEGTGTLGSTTVTLTGRIPGSETSPIRQEGEAVPYLFLGGLLFQELSRPYLKEWGVNWRSDAPQNLVAIDTYPKDCGFTGGRVVILSAVFPCRQTIGLDRLSNKVVISANGSPIHGLKDLKEALRHPVNGFHRIELEDSSGPIFLETSTLASDQEDLCQSFGIPSGTPIPDGNR